MNETLGTSNVITISVEVALVAAVRDEFADALTRLWLAPRAADVMRRAA